MKYDTMVPHPVFCLNSQFFYHFSLNHLFGEGLLNAGPSIRARLSPFRGQTSRLNAHSVTGGAMEDEKRFFCGSVDNTDGHGCEIFPSSNTSEFSQVPMEVYRVNK